MVDKNDTFVPDDEFVPDDRPTSVMGTLKQIPLGIARGAGNMAAAMAPAGMGEAIAANPQLYDIIEQQGGIPKQEEYDKLVNQQLKDIGVNSPENMPGNLAERMASGAGASVPWSAAMGPMGLLANTGIGMVGGAGGPLAEHLIKPETESGKNWSHIAGNLVGSFGAAGALAIAKGIYNMFGAPYRRLPGEFNLPATEGMLEPQNSPRRLGMLTEEQSMEKGARGPLARRIMDSHRTARNEEIEATRYNDFLGGEAATRTPAAAGEEAIGALQGEARALEAAGSEIYDAARASNPSRVVSQENLPIPAIDRMLRNMGIANIENYAGYPSAQRAHSMIENMQGRLNRLDSASTGVQRYEAQFNDMWETLKDIKRIRPTSAGDAEVYNAVRENFHNWMRDTLENVMFAGDREIIDNIAQADSIWRRLRQITNVDTRDPARDFTKLTSAIVRDARTPEEVAAYLLNTSSVYGSSKSARMAGFMRDTFGANSDVWQSIQAAGLYKALLADRPEQNGVQLANAIRNFTREKGAPLARELLSEDQIARLQRFEQSLRQTHPPLANPSGSGYEVGRTTWHAVLASVGLLEIATAMHMAPLKWGLAGGIPILMMLNNGRKALHATRDTMHGPGMMQRGVLAGVGALGASTEGQEGVP